MVTDDWMKRQAPNIFDPWTIRPTTISTEEFYRLKQEVEELKLKLKEARQEDIETGTPDCEMKESVEIIRRLAKVLNVNLEDIFDGHK